MAWIPVRTGAVATALVLAAAVVPSWAWAQRAAPAQVARGADTAPASTQNRPQSKNQIASEAATAAGQPSATAGEKPTLRTTQMCIEKAIANRLAVKRQRRKAVDRLFVKQARHELTAMGGYYSSDLFSGTYVAGGSYTYHMTETTAVEFGAAYTRANADVIRAIEAGRATILDEVSDRTVLVESLLIWSPIYGKLRMGGTVMRLDLNLGLGIGVVDAETSRGVAGVAGFGVKLFLGKAVALRIDARDHVFQQELLAERFLVNDLTVTSGISLFLPVGN